MNQKTKDRYNNIPEHTKERVDYFASELVAKNRLIRSLVRRNQYLTKRLMELEAEPLDRESLLEKINANAIPDDDFYDLMSKRLTVNPPYQANALNDEFSKLA